MYMYIHMDIFTLDSCFELPEKSDCIHYFSTDFEPQTEFRSLIKKIDRKMINTPTFVWFCLIQQKTRKCMMVVLSRVMLWASPANGKISNLYIKTVHLKHTTPGYRAIEVYLKPPGTSHALQGAPHLAPPRQPLGGLHTRRCFFFQLGAGLFVRICIGCFAGVFGGALLNEQIFGVFVG